MSEITSNIEFAHKINEDGHHHGSPSHGWAQWVGMAEALVLATVAVVTAWSGYQAAKWDALSAKKYAMVSHTTVLSQAKQTLAGQDRLYDIVTFNGWVAAKAAGREKLVAYYERRFRPEYAIAFAAWYKLDPVNNPAAPPGPIFMPEYRNQNQQDSSRLAKEADVYFEEAGNSRETGDQYIKVTVLLATVLLLTALSQRFELLGPRVAVVAVAVCLLAISTYLIATLPRL